MSDVTIDEILKRPLQHNHEVGDIFNIDARYVRLNPATAQTITNENLTIEENLIVDKLLAVGNEAFIKDNTAAYIFHQFDDDIDSRGLTASIRQMTPVTSPNYAKALHFDNYYYGDTYIGNPTITGAGLDDMTTGGTYTSGLTNKNMRVEIDAEGTPDTFKWSNDDGSSWEVETVAITGAAQTLENGIEITFAATTGHTLGDLWNFTAIGEAYRLSGVHGSVKIMSTAGRVSGTRGLFGNIILDGPGLIGSALGGRTSIAISGGGTINLAANFGVSNLDISDGLIVHLAGLWVEPPQTKGTGVIDNFYGVYIPHFTETPEPSPYGIRKGWGVHQVGRNDNVFSGDVFINNLKELRFYDANMLVGAANYVGFEVPALDADCIFVLPTGDGSAGQGLSTGGSKNLGWTTFLTSVSGGDHGTLSGLTDDDHTQYLLADGTRALAGAWDMNNEDLTNVDINTGDLAAAVVVGGVTASNLVDKSTTETIAGVWTYSAFPVTPSAAPTTNYQVANKKYVDDNAGGVVSDTAYYANCVATAANNVVGYSAWQDGFPLPLTQPVNVRSVDITVIPDLMQTIKGTVTVDGVDSDGAVVQEIFTFDTAAFEVQRGDVQFAIFTNIIVDAAGDSGIGSYMIGLGDKIGLQNYPWNATGDVIKVSKNGSYYSLANYTVDVTNGTILDTGANIQVGDFYCVWYRPNK